jgi:hypothetical protein
VEPVHAVVALPQAESRPAFTDLESLVAEVGASYPLIAYTALGDEELSEPERSEAALDSLILAGLVAP